VEVPEQTFFQNPLPCLMSLVTKHNVLIFIGKHQLYLSYFSWKNLDPESLGKYAWCLVLCVNLIVPLFSDVWSDSTLDVSVKSTFGWN
jgi:hypothetical protein